MEINESFVENVTVFSEWVSGNEEFRLVNLGAGPDKLQIKINNIWREESKCYRWGVLTERIRNLTQAKEKE